MEFQKKRISGALEGLRASSKSLSRVTDGDERVAVRNRREKYFPDEGSLICPSGRSMILYKKETEKIELVARPGEGPIVAGLIR